LHFLNSSIKSEWSLKEITDLLEASSTSLGVVEGSGTSIEESEEVKVFEVNEENPKSKQMR
jgi:hypothetical protein